MNERTQSNRVPLMVLLWVITLLAAFILGARVGEPEPLPPVVVDVTADPILVPEPKPAPALEEPVEAPAPPELPVEEITLERFHELLASGAQFYESVEFNNFMQQVTPEQAPLFIDEVLYGRRWVDTNEAGNLLASFYRKWANADFDAALQSAFAMPPGHLSDSVMRSIMYAYADKDSIAALEFYREHLMNRGSINNMAGAAVIAALTKVDPARALRELPGLMGEEPDYWLTSSFSREVIETKGLRSGIKLLGQVEDAELRLHLLKSFYSSAVHRMEPAEVAKTLNALENREDLLAATERVADAWSSRDPEESLAWARSLKDAEQRSLAFDEALVHWTIYDPVKAAEWLNQQPTDPMLDRGIELLIQTSMKQGNDPAAAFTWALALSDESTRRRGDASWALEEWLKQGGDPAEALTLIDNASLPQGEKQNLRRTLEKAQADE